MDLILGIVIIFFSLLGWLGQMLTAVSHKHAAKFGLTESESDVDPAFFADVRGEALWDTINLWILPVAGILLLLNNSWWAYFGLVGGGMYFYFAGRGIIVRIVMQRRGSRIGKPETLKVVYIFLTIWGLIALVTIFMAVADLRTA